MKGLRIFNIALFYIAFCYTIFLFAIQPLIHTAVVFSQKYYLTTEDDNPFDFLEDFEIDNSEEDNREEKNESKREESFEKEFRLKEFFHYESLVLETIGQDVTTSLRQIHNDHFHQQHIPEILVPPPKV